jgi:uncharacterized protein
MLLDINASVGHWPFKQVKDNSCAALLERMDRFGIAMAAVANLNGIFYKNTQAANEELFAEIRSDTRFEDRFLPFAVLNPLYAGWRKDLDTCCDRFGMRGIRVYPLYHDYELDEPALVELVQRARDRGLPVAFTLRMVDRRQRSWMDIDREWSLADVLPVIRAVPDAKYLILNIANGMALRDEEAGVIRDANVLIDTSGREISNLGELIQLYGDEKFAFGTHSPILDPVSSSCALKPSGKRRQVQRCWNRSGRATRKDSLD